MTINHDFLYSSLQGKYLHAPSPSGTKTRLLCSLCQRERVSLPLISREGCWLGEREVSGLGWDPAGWFR